MYSTQSLTTADLLAKMFPAEDCQGPVFWGFPLFCGMSPFQNQNSSRGWARKHQILVEKTDRNDFGWLLLTRSGKLWPDFGASFVALLKSIHASHSEILDLESWKLPLDALMGCIKSVNGLWRRVLGIHSDCSSG